MSGRTLSLVAVIAAAALVSCGQGPERLNLVIIAVDTLRPDHLGCYGYERNTSSRIDDFAMRSVLFEDAISQAPWTLASFATILTSLYPTQHGASAINTRMRESFPTLATMLKEQGYATGAIINAPALKPANGVDRGFDVYHMTPPEGRIAVGTTEDALEWIDSVKGQPFFAFVHYFDPHLSYAPPAPYHRLFDPAYEGRIGESFDLEGFSRVRDTMFEQLKALTQADWEHIVALYDGEIAYNDSGVGLLLDGLEARGLADNTLIVFLSDHGEEFFEHGGFEHGHTLYDELIKVPLIVSLPGRLPRGVRVKHQVRMVDVAPTILNIMGIQVPAHFEGVSLEPLMSGEGRIEPNRSALLPSDVAFSESLMHGMEKKGVRSSSWKLVYDMYRMERMLFNLEADPAEYTDVYKPAGTTVEMEQHLFDILFGISPTWYLELGAGPKSHTFDLEITAERGAAAGRIHPYRLFDSRGALVDAGDIISSNQNGTALRIQDLTFKGTMTLAFQAEPERIPVGFQITIDGKSAVEPILIGEGLANPEALPFHLKALRPRVQAGGRPSVEPEPPYVLIWHVPTPYRGKTTIQLDEQTKKELRALGYIQ